MGDGQSNDHPTSSSATHRGRSRLKMAGHNFYEDPGRGWVFLAPVSMFIQGRGVGVDDNTRRPLIESYSKGRHETYSGRKAIFHRIRGQQYTSPNFAGTLRSKRPGSRCRNRNRYEEIDGRIVFRCLQNERSPSHPVSDPDARIRDVAQVTSSSIHRRRRHSGSVQEPATGPRRGI